MQKNGDVKEGLIEKKLKSSYGIKRYKIQEVIKPGQVILIQVIKEGKRSKRCCAHYFYFFGWKIFGFNAQHTKKEEYFLEKIFHF